MIVIEGVDNAGKTTLAQRLAKDLKGIYLKSELIPLPDERSLERYVRLTTMASLFAPVVSDRHPAISDYIYAHVLREGHTPVRREMVEAFVYPTLNVIWCCPPQQTIRKSIVHTPQMNGVIQNIAALIRAYDAFFQLASVRFNSFLQYDYSASDAYHTLVRRMASEPYDAMTLRHLRGDDH